MRTIFDAAAQARFCALSGDVNPIHTDPVSARRTQAGGIIVHGIHTLLWLLDCLGQKEPRLESATRLKVQFRSVVYVGDEATVEIISDRPKVLRARAVVEGTEVLAASIGFEQSTFEGEFSNSPRERLPKLDKPAERSLDEMQGCAGRLEPIPDLAEAAALFPHASRCIGAKGVAALASSSYLVGMVVPGASSLFVGLDLQLLREPSAAAIDFEVSSVDSRFRFVTIAVMGAGVSGKLEAVSRPPVVLQPGMQQIRSIVRPGEFSGSTALVIGGSRGLGELTAKLVAAGGGHVLLTYASGKDDAERVASEIRAGGGTCETFRYLVRQSAAQQLAGLAAVPTHLYYFATPQIFRRKAGLCDSRRLADFIDFYVTGFLDLVESCQRRFPGDLAVFYPSSVFVSERPADLTEYAMAKAAGEILCADMAALLPGVRILVARLPRLPTDQTTSVVQPDTADPISVLVPIVRQMHGGSGDKSNPR